ncbi:hypothetical protein EBR21_09525 [bacterium]|nr:hypothetical protein [bacterium]
MPPDATPQRSFDSLTPAIGSVLCTNVEMEGFTCGFFPTGVLVVVGCGVDFITEGVPAEGADEKNFSPEQEETNITEDATTNPRANVFILFPGNSAAQSATDMTLANRKMVQKSQLQNSAKNCQNWKNI